MGRGPWTSLALTLALASFGASAPAEAQVASRVAQVENGTVRLTYETKPDVEICEQGVRIGDRHIWWHSRGWDDEPSRCRFGSAELELRVRDGEVRALDLVRSPAERSGRAVDIGAFGGQEVAEYLLALVHRGASVDAAEDAIFPAMIADAEEVWRDLLEIAKDGRVDDEVRERSLFWLGQEAATAATAGLAEVARDDDEDQEIRNAAIFALSQRPNDEGVPALMEIASSGREAETRRSAMFWLAQSGDERVLDFFERILMARKR